MRVIARLVKGGMSLADVDDMDEVDFLAWTIAFGEADGGEFDFDEMKWQTPRRA